MQYDVDLDKIVKMVLEELRKPAPIAIDEPSQQYGSFVAEKAGKINGITFNKGDTVHLNGEFVNIMPHPYAINVAELSEKAANLGTFAEDEAESIFANEDKAKPGTYGEIYDGTIAAPAMKVENINPYPNNPANQFRVNDVVKRKDGTQVPQRVTGIAYGYRRILLRFEDRMTEYPATDYELVSRPVAPPAPQQPAWNNHLAAPSCCSAISPCSHQQRNPTTICETCTKAGELGEQKKPFSETPEYVQIVGRAARPSRRHVTLAEIKEAEEDIEAMKGDYLKRFGWNYTCSTPGSYWLWQRDFSKEDAKRHADWKAAGPGPYGWPSEPRPYGVMTVKVDMAVSMTERLDDDR